MSTSFNRNNKSTVEKANKVLYEEVVGHLYRGPACEGKAGSQLQLERMRLARDTAQKLVDSGERSQARQFVRDAFSDNVAEIETFTVEGYEEYCKIMSQFSEWMTMLDDRGNVGDL